jgi:hypothetical protein
MPEKYITKDKVKEIIQNAPRGTSPAGIVSALRQQGYKLEGYDEAHTQEPGMLQSIAQGIAKPVLKVASTVKGIHEDSKKLLESWEDYKKEKKNAGQDVGMFAIDDFVKDIKNSNPEQKQKIKQSLLENKEPTKRDFGYFGQVENLKEINPFKPITDKDNIAGLKDAVGTAAEISSNFVPIGKAVGVAAKTGKIAAAGAEIGALSGGGTSLQQNKDVGDVIYDTTTGAAQGLATNLLLSKGMSALKGVGNTAGKVREKVITRPLSGMTDSQLFELKKGSSKIVNLDSEIDYARKAFADKSIESPFTKAGNRFSEAVDKVVNEKKTVYGKVINNTEEELSKGGALDFNSSFQKLDDTLSRHGLRIGEEGVEHSNPYLKDISGMNMKTVSDAVAAAQSALASGDVKAVRAVASTLKSVARDNYDEVQKKFKDSSFKMIEQLGKDLNEQVNEEVSKKLSPEKALKYREAIKEYAIRSKLGQSANALLGKEGVQGGDVKAGSVAKAVTQSIHNQSEGVRQLANMVKEKSGYDFFKDANNADLMMQAVGDYRGQSINSLLQNTSETFSQAGMIKKAVGVVLGSQAKNTERMVRKYNSADTEKITNDVLKALKKQGVKKLTGPVMQAIVRHVKKQVVIESGRED